MQRKLFGVFGADLPTIIVEGDLDAEILRILRPQGVSRNAAEAAQESERKEGHCGWPGGGDD